MIGRRRRDPRTEDLPHWLTGGMCDCVLVEGKHPRCVCDGERDPDTPTDEEET